MPRSFDKFEEIALAIAASHPPQATTIVPTAAEPANPFDERNIHPDLPRKVRTLFDDGHYPEATFLAFKFLDKRVHKHSGIPESGQKLMMAAFSASNPKIKLNPLVTTSEVDEQEGYRFIFAGGMQGIRNPRGHEHTIVDDPDICLDHLSFVSLLLRRLEQAGYK
jgi:uncharacterized protein (TIGR02391 family)